jgi:hypothetical protein
MSIKQYYQQKFKAIAFVPDIDLNLPPPKTNSYVTIEKKKLPIYADLLWRERIALDLNKNWVLDESVQLKLNIFTASMQVFACAQNPLKITLSLMGQQQDLAIEDLALLENFEQLPHADLLLTRLKQYRQMLEEAETIFLKIFYHSRSSEELSDMSLIPAIANLFNLEYQTYVSRSNPH